MKKTKENFISVYNIVSIAKLGKMDIAEKFALIKATRELKKVAMDFDDLLKEIREQHEPETLATIFDKIKTNQPLTDEEGALWAKYNECVNHEVAKEIELNFEPLNEATLGHFFDSNDFSMSEILTISDVLGE